MTLTVGSLFSGIGGLELGLERAGMRVVWQVEIDDYCRRVLAKHWPDVPKFTDVREVGAHNLEPVDLICGGFPCQDISYAGKGAGLAGERSGLWYEFARIIRELRPRYVLVENVAALLTRGLGDVLGTLASLGYDAEWDCVSAASVGAPHLRRRIFVIAYARELRRESRRSPESLQGARPLGAPRMADTDFPRLEGRNGAVVRERAGERIVRTGNTSDVAHANRIPREAGRDDKPRIQPRHRTGFSRSRSDNGWWRTEPDVGRVAHGVPSRVDRLKGLGNAVVPQVAEFIGKLIVEADEWGGSGEVEGGTAA